MDEKETQGQEEKVETAESATAPAAPQGERPAREARPPRREGGYGQRSGGGGGYRGGDRGGDRGDRGGRGDRGDRGGRGGDDGPGGRRRRFGHRKQCQCCVNKVKMVDYKDVNLLRHFITDRGKIRPRRLSGACAPHQRELTTAIKRARNIALLPFKA